MSAALLRRRASAVAWIMFLERRTYPRNRPGSNPPQRLMPAEDVSRLREGRLVDGACAPPSGISSSACRLAASRKVWRSLSQFHPNLRRIRADISCTGCQVPAFSKLTPLTLSLSPWERDRVRGDSLVRGTIERYVSAYWKQRYLIGTPMAVRLSCRPAMSFSKAGTVSSRMCLVSSKIALAAGPAFHCWLCMSFMLLSMLS